MSNYMKEQMKEKEDEDRIQSPYTKFYPKEKTLPYVLTGIVIIILVIIAVVWSVRQITIDNNGSNIIGYYEIGE